MSRVIKFRGWNSKGSAMVDLHKITPLALADDFKPALVGAGIGVYIPDHPEIEVMQFTGLHDRNGVEIYEGDIFRDEDGIWVVDFEVGTFVLRSVPDTQYTCRLGVHAGAGEVIGNIHANPELLEGEKV